MTTLARSVLVCAAIASLRAQATVAQKQLVDQLGGPQREAAHRQLVATGAKAVPALIEGLEDPHPEVVSQVLAILAELGPDAKPAAPVLVKRLLASNGEPSLEHLAAVADLAPFCPDISPDQRELTQLSIRFHMPGKTPSQEGLQVITRFRVRMGFATERTLEDLIEVLGCYQPYRIEAAVDLLAPRGPAARAALPALQALLARADPRVLMTGRTVPIRSRAARAILAIDDAAAGAATARAVLAGAPPPAPATPQVPERARTRVAELIAELAEPRKREAAVTNLVSLGPLCVAPLATALADEHDAEFREAALTVLREIGPRAVDAVPQLFDLLPQWPAENLVSLMNTLTAIAPWSHDAMPSLSYSGGGGSMSILGKPVRGADEELCNAFHDAHMTFVAVMSVDLGSGPGELRQHLQSRSVAIREAALAVLRRRGPEARPLLPAIASMFDEPQPPLLVAFWSGKGGRNEDRTNVVQRLAAQAVVAIAPPDDPLVARARAVLTRLPDLRQPK